MNNKVFIPIWKAEEYSYPLAFDFRPGMLNRGPMARDAVKEVSGWCREAIDFLDEVWSVR